VSLFSKLHSSNLFKETFNEKPTFYKDNSHINETDFERIRVRDPVTVPAVLLAADKVVQNGFGFFVANLKVYKVRLSIVGVRVQNLKNKYNMVFSGCVPSNNEIVSSKRCLF
jgi:hypothetical protein